VVTLPPALVAAVVEVGQTMLALVALAETAQTPVAAVVAAARETKTMTAVQVALVVTVKSKFGYSDEVFRTK